MNTYVFKTVDDYIAVRELSLEAAKEIMDDLVGEGNYTYLQTKDETTTVVFRLSDYK